MLGINLTGKIAFVAGVGDDQGFGWAITKALKEAGATVLVGTWAPMMKIFEQGLNSGKFDESRKLSDGSLFTIDKIYAFDASFDTPDQVPVEIRENKRYQNHPRFTLSEVAEDVEKDFGRIDILVHALANAPEIKKPLLETSREGYSAALSASSYSLIALLQQFGPRMNPGGSALALTYLAGARAIPGYGGGMSSAKAALEGDIKTLAWEVGRKWQLRLNAISAGPYRSRAAKAIGFIDEMIRYSCANAPLSRELQADDVGQSAAFLLSPLSQAITGSTLYVDHGLHAMGAAQDSASQVAEEKPQDNTRKLLELLERSQQRVLERHKIQ